MIKKQTIILLVTIGMFQTIDLTAQSPFLEQDTKDFIELKKLSLDFFEAVKSRDSLTMARSLADEFTLTSSESNGELLRKTVYIGGSLRADVLEVISYRLYDFKIRRYGDIAIVQSRIDWKSQYLGRPWNADFLNTDVLIWREDRWQVVHRHSSYPANYLSEVVKMRGR